MKSNYFKFLATAFTVLALLVLSVYVVSAENNNNNNDNNNHDGYQSCENQSGDHYGYQDDHEDNDCSKPEYCNDKSRHDDHEDNNCSEPKKYHYACVQNACTKVEGKGDNTCNSDTHCGVDEVSPTPTVTPTVTPTPTVTTTNTGGPGDGKSDGQGCGSHDCSGNHGQVLGASTGPMQAVLGLSTTSGNENSALVFAQLIAAFTLSATGFAFFKKNA